MTIWIGLNWIHRRTRKVVILLVS